MGKTLKLNVYHIPPHLPFLEALASELLFETKEDPISLSNYRIFLPTRRACRHLKEKLLTLKGNTSVFLPKLIPLGELEEDKAFFEEESKTLATTLKDLPEPLSEARRQILLSQLILKFSNTLKQKEAPSQNLTPDQAIKLASELMKLIDQVETEGIGLKNLKTLVPKDYATHWEITLEFLKILTEYWPQILKEEGRIEKATYRRLLMEAQVKDWQASPPKFPVIAAGSSGSIPATRKLLSVIAGMPQGRLIFAGFDPSLPESARKILPPTHPQFCLSQLLDSLNLLPQEIQPFPSQEPLAFLKNYLKLKGRHLALPERFTLFNQAMSDPIQGAQEKDFQASLKDVEKIECVTPQEEAASIALILRHSLEKPFKTAALITPDRLLVKRVMAELNRWGIMVDDSGGVPLAHTPLGTFLSLCVEYLTHKTSLIPFLSLLKHPFLRMKKEAERITEIISYIEKHVLRTRLSAPLIFSSAFVYILHQLEKQEEEKNEIYFETKAWLLNLSSLLAPLNRLFSLKEIHFEEALNLHLKTVEALVHFAETYTPAHLLNCPPLTLDLNSKASLFENTPLPLWKDEAGKCAALFLKDLYPAVQNLQNFPTKHYAAFFKTLLEEHTVRLQPNATRLAIYGPLEARLLSADLVILASLNEKTWPPEIGIDPWMSRPMRVNLGLPLPERRIGLSAHDFLQGFLAPKVYLTRSLRVEGTPTIPSRWLSRLEVFLKQRSLSLQEGHKWLTWAQFLEMPKDFFSSSPPAPCPPLSARPRQLPVTKIETWLKDPYAIYAQYILKLKALRPLEKEISASDFGILLHRILDHYNKALSNLKTLPPYKEAEELLHSISEETLKPFQASPFIQTFWKNRLSKNLKHFLNIDYESRLKGAQVFSEVPGFLQIHSSKESFTLTAIADRIEVYPDGKIALIDYKTGFVPSYKEALMGYSPQLPLLSAIHLYGSFKAPVKGELQKLAFWLFKDQEEIEDLLKGNLQEIAESAFYGLQKLLIHFEDPTTCYRASPDLEKIPLFNDYMHLERLKEWGGIISNWKHKR